MREWIAGLEEDPEQPHARPVTMEHPHPSRSLWGALVVAADAVIAYEVDHDAQAVTVLHIGQDPPEYMS